MILPYLDKKELYEKLSPNQQYSLREALGQEELQSIAKSTNENFVCPVDASLDEENPDRLLDPGGLDFSAARANYVASTGVTRTAGQGVFFLHSRIRFRDIKDGSSNVFLLGERTSGDAANTGRHGASVWIGVTATKAWDAGLPSDAESTLYGTTAVEMQTGKKLTGRPGFAPRLGFSSDHTWRNKAACFLMADGTVKKINPDIDSRIGKDPSDTDGWGVYQLLSSRSDGKRIPESAFRNR
ncbi:MAG: DUF1559 domain-containing protein [Planctomycetes bacterium]|nr:DUF1559 domain-containing protein [Planctomycetota bacterium]